MDQKYEYICQYLLGYNFQKHKVTNYAFQHVYTSLKSNKVEDEILSLGHHYFSSTPSDIVSAFLIFLFVWKTLSSAVSNYPLVITHQPGAHNELNKENVPQALNTRTIDFFATE